MSIESARELYKALEAKTAKYKGQQKKRAEVIIEKLEEIRKKAHPREA